MRRMEHPMLSKRGHRGGGAPAWIEPGVIDVFAGIDPRPGPRFGMAPPLSFSVPHVAVGLWVATLLVLVVPGRRKVTENDLIRAYGVCTPLFALV
jgi:hypothetical protein